MCLEGDVGASVIHVGGRGYVDGTCLVGALGCVGVCGVRELTVGVCMGDPRVQWCAFVNWRRWCLALSFFSDPQCYSGLASGL